METHDEENEATEATDDQALDHPRQPRALQTMRRDFGGMSLSMDNGATAALVAKSRADTEARWLMAMRNPRNLDDVRQAITKECKRPGFAEVAIYAVPRGDKTIKGLSIRFAEVAARCMTNMPIEVQTIFDSDSDRTVRVTVTDLETNVTWSRDITVKKTIERKHLKRGQRPLGERVNSYGDRVFIVEATEDEVNVKESAQVSKAARTGILRLIPGHLQDEAFDLCEKIFADKTAKDPDAAKNKVLDAFGSLNIMPSDLEQWLGHDTAKMSPAEVEQLRRVFVAIGEGETSWADALESASKRKMTPTKAPDTAKPAPQTAPTTQAAKPQTAPAQGEAKPTSGKGTAALKTAMAPKAKPDEQPPVVEAPPVDEHPCPDCGVPCLPPGKCAACAAS